MYKPFVVFDYGNRVISGSSLKLFIVHSPAMEEPDDGELHPLVVF